MILDLVPRKTAEPQPIPVPQLSPSAALRMLRTIVYPQSSVYVAPIPMDRDDSPQPLLVLDPDSSEDFEGTTEGTEDQAAVAPAYILPSSDGPRYWYLNEVPSDWLEDPHTDEAPATPIVDIAETPAPAPKPKPTRRRSTAKARTR